MTLDSRILQVYQEQPALNKCQTWCHWLQNTATMAVLDNNKGKAQLMLVVNYLRCPKFFGMLSPNQFS